MMFSVLVFCFQAEDGIRDLYVTGVQTCALPISGTRLRPAQPPGLFMLDLNHDQALRWNRGAGFGAVPEFIEALDIRRGKFAAAHVQKRSNHLAHHVTQERTAANGKNQFFVVRSARQLSRVDFALSGAFFIVVFRTGGSGKRGKVVHANEPRRRVAHSVFVQREWVVENVTPNCGRHHFSAIEAIAVGLAARGPAGIEIRADLFCAESPDRVRKLATCPSACTPASVRPAPCNIIFSCVSCWSTLTISP